MKTATGGACGTSLNMDMAQSQADDPGAGGGDGERVLPETGRERETGPGSPSAGCWSRTHTESWASTRQPIGGRVTLT